MVNKKNFILHLHPDEVPAGVLRFSHTYGLGGMTALLLLLQMVTGVLLRFVYEPTPAGAYDSILFLERQVALGQFIRNVHHWGAVLLVITVTLHLLRVFYTGAFHPPVRSGNWIIGMVMFLLVLLSNFTGYLLPWDQLSYWAVTVVTSMLGYVPVAGDRLVEWVRGGPDVGGSTLLLFFNLHTGVLPLTLLALMLFHFWRVRRAGGVVPPRRGHDDDAVRVATVPHLVVREAAAAALLLAFLFVLALGADAPLLARANPAHSPDPAKAPWYFLGIQELLLHFHPLISALLLPLTFLTLLFALPYLPYPQRNQGIPFFSEKGRRLARLAAAAALLLTPLLIVADEYLLHFHSWWPSLPPLISEGIIPLALYLTLTGTLWWWVKRKYHPVTGESVTAFFTFFLVTYTVLSLTGIFFRGTGMMLTWPWNL